MIRRFEAETAPLTDYERKVLVPWMKSYLNGYAKGTPRKNGEIARYLKQKTGRNVHGATVRKLINFIRVTHTVRRLVSSNQGYWITEDEEDLKDYILSLRDRLRAIRGVYRALIRDYKKFYK